MFQQLCIVTIMITAGTNIEWFDEVGLRPTYWPELHGLVTVITCHYLFNLKTC